MCDRGPGGQDPEAGFVHTVVAEAAGTPRALAPLYMAAARQLGFPMEICNCSLSFKTPVEFLVVRCPPPHPPTHPPPYRLASLVLVSLSPLHKNTLGLYSRLPVIYVPQLLLFSARR
jgi:hypothetical protein